MTRRDCLYKRPRFPPEIIQHAVWLCFRFNLSHRDIEDLLARRGIVVTHESIRLWCNKFGPRYAHRLRRGHRGNGDTVFMDEVFVRIRGQYQYLWRAVDQDGEVVDVLLQERRDAASARRFFRHLHSRLGGEPRTIVMQHSQAASYSSVYVFGDDYSDGGNAYAISGGSFPPPPYPMGASQTVRRPSSEWLKVSEWS